MNVKMTEKQLIELWREETIEIEGVTYTIVEEGEWDGAGEKYQTLEVVFTDGERFYSGTITKSGSYFSDWEYNDYGDASITEVTKVTRTVTVESWDSVLEYGHAIYEVGAEDCGWCCVNDEGLTSLISELRDGDTESPDSNFVNIIGTAVRTADGWHSTHEKEAV